MENQLIPTKKTVNWKDFWRSCSVEEESKGVYLVLTDYETYLVVDTAFDFGNGLEGWKITETESVQVPNEQVAQEVFDLVAEFIESELQPVYTESDNYGLYNSQY